MDTNGTKVGGRRVLHAPHAGTGRLVVEGSGTFFSSSGVLLFLAGLNLL